MPVYPMLIINQVFPHVAFLPFFKKISFLIWSSSAPTYYSQLRTGATSVISEMLQSSPGWQFSIKKGNKEQSVWLLMSVCIGSSLEKSQGLKYFRKYWMLSLQATLLSQECSYWGQIKLIQGLGKSVHLFSQTNLLSSSLQNLPCCDSSGQIQVTLL